MTKSLKTKETKKWCDTIQFLMNGVLLKNSKTVCYNLVEVIFKKK